MQPVDVFMGIAQRLVAAEGGGVVFAVGFDGAGGGLRQVGGGVLVRPGLTRLINVTTKKELE